MKRQSRLFLAFFTVTGGLVFVLARDERPAYAAAAGIVGLLLHWGLSTGNDSDAELADASYFLGFLLTLVMLAAGLWSLASTGGATAATTRATGAVLYQFLYDLGAGLTITIAGLAIRQVRTLSATRESAPQTLIAAPEPSIEPLLLRELIEVVKRLPDNVAARAASNPDEHARRSVEEVERSIAEIAPRIINSMSRLEDSVTTTAATLTRTASTLGDSFTQTSERVESQLADVLTLLAKERAAMLAQFEAWQHTMTDAHKMLVDGHQTLDTEYRRGLLAVSAAGRSFSQLSNQVASDIQRLPNPAERLENLWTGMETLDQRLRASIGDAGARLAALGTQADNTGASVERLSQSLRAAATQIERGGGEASATLQRELAELSTVLDDFVALLNERVEAIGAR